MGSERQLNSSAPRNLGVGAESAGDETFARLTATFADRATENAYQDFIINNKAIRESRLCQLLVGVYFLYGILDILTIKENLSLILTVRWLVITPVVFLCASASFFPALKKRFAYAHTFGVFIFAISIVWMISILPPNNSPPYIIGVLMVFIFASCNIIMPFLAASAVFVITAVIYSAMLLMVNDFSSTQVISGFFFMTSSVIVAIATNYRQETRSRLIWFRERQRELDAQHIRSLMIEATAADQSKINFLSILSHELKTPLHQIIGFTEIVVSQDRELPNCDRSSFLQEIHIAATRLLGQIGKMLRYADAVAGKLAYNADFYPIAEVVETAVGEACLKAEAAQVELVAKDVKAATINLDHVTTAYAVGLIIDNAIKASPAGSSVRLVGELSRDGAYELKVIDAGCGMSPAQIKKALAPFSQSFEAKTRPTEGIGLGLTLAQKVLGDQQISLSIDSTEGVGTSVTLNFPSDLVQSRIPSPGPSPGQSSNAA